jgi:hypothetical protein
MSGDPGEIISLKCVYCPPGREDGIKLYMTENMVERYIKNNVINKPIKGFLDYMKTTINSIITGQAEDAEAGEPATWLYPVRIAARGLPPKINDTDTLSILYNRRVYNERDIIATDVEQYEAFVRRFTSPAFPPPAGMVKIIVNPDEAKQWRGKFVRDGRILGHVGSIKKKKKSHKKKKTIYRKKKSNRKKKKSHRKKKKSHRKKKKSHRK